MHIGAFDDEPATVAMMDKYLEENSYVNFVWITEDSNRAISDDPLDKYAKEIKSTAKAKLHISVYTTDTDADTDQKIHGILEQRFDYLKGDIENTVQALLANWKAGNVTI